MDELELMKTHVLITREEFGEYVLLKRDATIAEAERNIKQQKLQTMQQMSHDAVLESYFRYERMGSDSRAEQTDLRSANNYAGFSQKTLKFLRDSLGYTDEEIRRFIDVQWDIKEAREHLEEEGE